MNNKLIIWLLSCVLLVSACDPCEDCGEPLVYDPLVTLKFINQDSAFKLEVAIDSNLSTISSNNDFRAQFLDSINSLNDSLEVLDSLVQAGETKWLSQLEKVNLHIDSIRDVRDSLALENSSITSTNRNLSAIVNEIETGLIALNDVLILDNQSEISFEDSMTTFKVPLLFSNSSTSYLFTIDGNTYESTFKYDPVEVVSQRGIVRITGSNLAIPDHSFDSLKINCPTSDCISDEATVTFYF